MFSDFGPENEFWQEPDFLLTGLISAMVNRSEMEIGITLVVRGTVLTGTLISERAYLASMSEAFVMQAKRSAPASSPEELEAIREMFDFNDLTEEMYDLDGLETDEEIPELPDLDAVDLDLPPIRHLHLKDPTILLPQPSITFSHSEISIMRIRLASVDGWILGRAAVIPIDESRNTPPQVLH